MTTKANLVRRWRTPLVLMGLTFLSTFFVGSVRVHEWELPNTAGAFLDGWVYALPLMAILMAHEFGHFIAAMIHRVDVSPPYFIPLPIALGTLGAVIQIRERIRSRNALLDIGAAGPLAGMVVALPVVIYGLHTSPVEPIEEGLEYWVEGHSLLYVALLDLIKGPIPSGHDVMLNPTALAGWVGLLVTMINLIPFGQLDGGHVGYALVGPKQNRISYWVLRLMPVVAVVVGLAYAVPSYVSGERGEALINDLAAGGHWLMWGLLLYVMSRYTGGEHPPTEDDELSPKRRVVAMGTLFLFVLLFMPSWIRVMP